MPEPTMTRELYDELQLIGLEACEVGSQLRIEANFLRSLT